MGDVASTTALLVAQPCIEVAREMYRGPLHGMPPAGNAEPALATGPLYAAYDADDAEHSRCRRLLQNVGGSEGRVAANSFAGAQVSVATNSHPDNGNHNPANAPWSDCRPVLDARTIAQPAGRLS